MEASIWSTFTRFDVWRTIFVSSTSPTRSSLTTVVRAWRQLLRRVSLQRNVLFVGKPSYKEHSTNSLKSSTSRNTRKYSWLKQELREQMVVNVVVALVQSRKGAQRLCFGRVHDEQAVLALLPDAFDRQLQHRHEAAEAEKVKGVVLLCNRVKDLVWREAVLQSTIPQSAIAKDRDVNVTINIVNLLKDTATDRENRLYEKVHETQKLLQQPKTDWQKCCLSIDELATAVESIGQLEDYKDVVRVLLTLSSNLGLQIRAARSKQVKEVCEHLTRIVVVTERDFEDMANALLPDIVNTSKSTSVAIRQPGSKLLNTLTKIVRYDLTLLRKIYMQCMQERTRILVLDQVQLILVYWSDEEVLPRVSDVLAIVQEGLQDQQTEVRKVAREVLSRFSSRWKERVDELVEMLPTLARPLLIQDHRDSPIAVAIMKRYPELTPKPTIPLNRKAPTAKSRPKLQKPSQLERELNIKKHVATPSQREQQEALEQELISALASNATSPAAASVTTESSAAARRSSDNYDYSRGSDDSQQQAYIPEAFNGSQLREFYAKRVIAPPHAPGSEQIPSARASIHSQTAEEQISCAPNVEGTLLQRRSTRQLKGSHIPSPSTRSPRSYSRKYLDSPTRSDNSSEPRLSLYSRPESFSLDSQTNAASSASVGNVHSDEEKAESNPLSASDEYFSKLIPSSIDAPTPSPPSTENVTLRPKRRPLACQEHDDLRPQVYSSVPSSPELAVFGEFIQSQSVEIAPESVVSSSQFSQEDVEQCVDYALDSEDNGDHWIGESDHVKSGNARRLDDRQSQRDDSSDCEDTSDSRAGYAEENDDKLKPSGEGVIPDESRFGEESGCTREHCNELIRDDFVGVIDSKTPTACEPEVSEAVGRIGSLLEEDCLTQNDTGKGDREDELSAKSESTSFCKDAVTRMSNLNADIKDLQEQLKDKVYCSNYVEETSSDALDVQAPWTRTDWSVLNTTDAVIAKEAHPVKHDTEPQDDNSKREGHLYLERLKHADNLSRISLSVPNFDIPGELLKERGLLKAPEQVLDQATARNAANGESEESDFVDMQSPHGSPRASQLLSAKVDEFGHVQKDRKMTGREQIVQKDARFYEQTGRFDKAEKLFAANEVSSPQPRPQPPISKRRMHSEPRHEPLPPTQLGTKLNPSDAKTRMKAVAAGGSKIDATISDAATEDVAAVATTEMRAMGPEPVSPKGRQAVPKHDKANEMSALDCAKHDASSLTSTATACSTSKPPVVAQGDDASPATLGWFRSFAITITVFFAAIFCMTGILQAAKKMQDSHAYHLALTTRIKKFEKSIHESHEKVVKLEEDYAVWSEYVRKLTEDDEVHALAQLEAIQAEVQKWQQEMKEDLGTFRQALSVDSLKTSFAEFERERRQP